MNHGACILFFGGLLAAQTSLSEQSAFVMSSPKSTGNTDVQIIGGVAVIQLGIWPATAVFEGVNKRPCTATVVGPQVILTAAHCVKNNSNGKLKLRNQAEISLNCKHHKNKNGIEYDIAVCVSDIQITLPYSGGYERVGTDPSIPKQNDKVQLLGFGCTVAGSPAFGILYEGHATVTLAPSAIKPRIQTKGGAVGCAGDSGGAAYVEISKDERVIVGVNSEANDTTTYLAALTDPDTLSLLRETKTKSSNGSWEAAKICGIDQLDNCR